MVIINAAVNSAEPMIMESKLEMESGRVIYYSAPSSASGDFHANEHEQVVMMAKSNRLLFGDTNDELDKWSGVNNICQAFDHIVEVEKDSHIFEGQSVLEVGFCTGVPTVYAIMMGAKDATLYNDESAAFDLYIKPTINSNNLATKCSYITGNLDKFKEIIGDDKFDTIIAPELVNAPLSDLETIHDKLNQFLADNGFIFISGRTHYNNTDGNLTAFLEIVKQRNVFDAVERWSTCRTSTAPRKVIQLMRRFV